MTHAQATADETLDADLHPLPLQQCGLALSWSLALFGMWAYLVSAGVFTWSRASDGGGLFGYVSAVNERSAGFILLAALSVVLQVSSNYSAAAARRAKVLKLAGSHIWAVRLMVAGGFYNAFSVHHAWETTGLVTPLFPLTAETLIGNAPLLLLALVLAFFEPALYWIDEALRAEADQWRARALKRDADSRAQSERQALADRRAHTEAMAAHADGAGDRFVDRLKQAGDHAVKGAAAGSTVFGGAAAYADQPPTTVTLTPAQAEIAASVSYETPEAHVEALWRAGVRNKAEIGRLTHQPRSTVCRWIAAAIRAGRLAEEAA